MRNEIRNGIIIACVLIVISGFFIWPAMSFSCRGGSDCFQFFWVEIMVVVAGIIAAILIFTKKSENVSTSTSPVPTSSNSKLIKIILAIVIVIVMTFYLYEKLFSIRNHASRVTPDMMMR